MQSTPKPGETFWLWFLKILTGLLILVILGVHLVVNHFLAPQGLLSHAEVVAYYQNPIVPLMEGLFLLFLVSHSLLGLRSILLDLNAGPRLLRLADAFFLLFGAGVSVYGLWLLYTVRSLGA
ncbi:MAG: hypothetical protein Fur0018_22280 [Anaerolineales bacterium]